MNNIHVALKEESILNDNDFYYFLENLRIKTKGNLSIEEFDDTVFFDYSKNRVRKINALFQIFFHFLRLTDRNLNNLKINFDCVEIEISCFRDCYYKEYYLRLDNRYDLETRDLLNYDFLELLSKEITYLSKKSKKWQSLYDEEGV